jgi:ketosteroid isomerase-like protein
LFIDGRVEETKPLLDPDISWSEPEEAPDRHVVEGVDNAMDALNNWLSTWCDYELELVDAVAGPDDRVFQSMRQRATGAVSGVPFESDLFQVWWLREGKPYRMEMFFDRQKALAAAGLA